MRLLILGMVFLFFGCKKETNNIDYASDYFPTGIGTFRRYAVQSDTTFYEVREEIVGDTIVEGRNYYTLQRRSGYIFYRYDDTNLYVYNENDTIDPEGIALKVNQPPGTTWTEWDFFDPTYTREILITVIAVNSNRTVQGHLFEDVIEISIEVFEHQPGQPSRSAGVWYQWYAKGIGLIEYSDSTIYDQELAEWNIVH